MGLDIGLYDNRNSLELCYFGKYYFITEFLKHYGFDINQYNHCWFPVSREILNELLDRCNKVLENNNLGKELLPMDKYFITNSSYYTEEDEKYYIHLNHLKEELEKVLNDLYNDCEYFDIWISY